MDNLILNAYKNAYKMDNLILNAYKNAYKWVSEKVANQQTVGNAGGSAGARTPDHLIKSQM